MLVAQQFEVAKQVLAHGMMPIIEPEVNIKSADRAESDDLLLAAILEELDEIPDGQQVMLKLSIPAEAGPVRSAWSTIPRCCASSRCRAVSAREEACRELAQESRHDRQLQPRPAVRPAPAQQSDEEFDRTLGTAIDEIYQASTAKVPA